MNRPIINVTPLIDVLLVLLIIFMVVSPLKPSHIESKLPQEPENKIIEPNPWALVVEIHANRTVSLNNDREYGSFDELKKLTSDLERVFDERRMSLIADSGDRTASELGRARTVFVKAPKSMLYGSVIKVIDAVKHGGADPVSLQIDGLDN